MPDVLEALVDSWDRNNTITVNLLRALPEGTMELRVFQHLIWHEGYHHAQIKLALKVAGRPFDDEEIGPVTWDVWMEKT